VCSMFSPGLLSPCSICLRYLYLVLVNRRRHPSRATAACFSLSLWTTGPTSIPRCGPSCLAYVLGLRFSAPGISPSAFSCIASSPVTVLSHTSPCLLATTSASS
jgi:hypothetical protein